MTASNVRTQAEVTESQAHSKGTSLAKHTAGISVTPISRRTVIQSRKLGGHTAHLTGEHEGKQRSHLLVLNEG